MWTLYDSFEDFIAPCWSTPVFGCPMYILTKKLQLFKNSLKSWKKDVFGNIHAMVKKSTDNLAKIQS